FPGRRPVIINIHGGPEGQSRPGFLGRNNYYVNELGVALIFPNVRGSTGHGKTFAKLDNGTLRDGAYRDIGALLDWIRTRPDLDDPRVPHSEADQMVAALKQRSVPVWYLLAKDEGHGFRKKPNQDFQFYATILFTQRYLLGREVSQVSP